MERIIDGPDGLDGDEGQEAQGPWLSDGAHTPGPWSFDGHGINSSEGERIAKVQHERHSFAPSGKGLVLNERFDADSKLLAKAWLIPDLVASLENCATLISKARAGYRVEYEMWDQCWQAATETLAKAKAA